MRMWTTARRHGPAIIAALFTGSTLILMLLVDYTDDEGFQAYIYTRILTQEPVAGIFFQKLKCAGTMLYLPVFGFGWKAFLVWHKVLAGAGIYLLGKATEGLTRKGWIAALVLATSPAYIFSSMAGHSNIVGVLYAALVLYLLVARRSVFWAGLALGAMPWVRHEYVVLVAGLALYAVLKDRNPRFFAGLFIFPVVYLSAGAVYHGDVLWWLHFLPALTVPEPTCTWNRQWEAAYLQQLVSMLGVITPAWPLIFLASWRRQSPLEKTLLISLLVTFLFMFIVPFTRFLKFDHDVRYWLVFLPFLSVGAGSLDLAEKRRSAAYLCGGLSLAGIVLGLSEMTVGLWLPVMIACSIPLLMLAVGLTLRKPVYQVAAFLVMVVVVLVASPRTSPWYHHLRYRPHPGIPQAAGWLAGDQRAAQARAVYTNLHQLDMFFRDEYPGSGININYLVQYDIQYELYHILNRDNHQYRDVLKAIGPHLFGAATWTCQFADRRDYSGDIFVINDDYRLRVTYPDKFWECMSDEVVRYADISIRAGKPFSADPECQGAGVVLDDPAVREPCRPE